MSQININSAIEFIGNFFSELPPQAIAIIISIATLGLYIMFGVVVAAISGFLALAITKNGIAISILCAFLVTVFSIYGVVKAIRNYKNILQRYNISKS